MEKTFVILVILATLIIILLVLRNKIKARALIWAGFYVTLGENWSSFNKFVIKILNYKPKPAEAEFFLEQLRYLHEKVLNLKRKPKKDLPFGTERENLEDLVKKIETRQNEVAQLL